MSCPARLSEGHELHEQHGEILKLVLNFPSIQPGRSAVNPATQPPLPRNSPATDSTQGHGHSHLGTCRKMKTSPSS